MNTPSFDKFASFERARKLLDSNDDSALRYACLELRFCLEALAYDKIRLYAKWLPPSVYKKWQPPQLIKTLVKLEPYATASSTVRIRAEDKDGNPVGDWLPLGTQEPLDIRWLEKAYNILGNFLHIPNPRIEEPNPKNTAPKEIRDKLEEIIKELQPKIANPFGAALAEIVPFDCIECKKPTASNKNYIGQSEPIECLTPGCGALYSAKETDEGKVIFETHGTPHICPECKEERFLDTHKLAIGYAFRCGNCATEYQLTGYQLSEIQRAKPENI